MKLIVGLGNPGQEYASTRHNAGFMAVNFLQEHFGFQPFKLSEKHKAEVASGEIAGEKVILVKPQTYMNLSGKAVASLAQFYKIPTADIIVIYDEADLPIGTGRPRISGSSAGHIGVQSIIDVLGPDFGRLRLGIKPTQPFPGELEDYVLGNLTTEEKLALDGIIKQIPSLVEKITEKGMAETILQSIQWPIKF